MPQRVEDAYSDSVPGDRSGNSYLGADLKLRIFK
jgi:hypothetical protein